MFRQSGSMIVNSCYTVGRKDQHHHPFKSLSNLYQWIDIPSKSQKIIELVKIPIDTLNGNGCLLPLSSTQTRRSLVNLLSPSDTIGKLPNLGNTPTPSTRPIHHLTLGTPIYTKVRPHSTFTSQTLTITPIHPLRARPVPSQLAPLSLGTIGYSLAVEGAAEIGAVRV